MKPFIERARKRWLELLNREDDGHLSVVHQYLQVIKDAANSIASLTTVPLTDRRFLIDFPAAVQGINMPGLEGGLVDLIVPAEPIEPDWDNWFDSWKSAFSSFIQIDKQPLAYSRFRRSYYGKAINGLKDENSHAALWLLLWTWSFFASLLPGNDPSQKGFKELLGQLTLDKEHFPERLSSLDKFLDAVEESIDRWSAASGL